MKDYYAILEVPPDAQQEKIKEQWRFLVHAWHPDKFPNPAQKSKAEEKIKEINEAYEILSNPTKRAQYDREHGGAWFNEEERIREKTRAQAEQRRAEQERQQKQQAEEKQKRSEYERSQRERAEREQRQQEHAARTSATSKASTENVTAMRKPRVSGLAASIIGVGLLLAVICIVAAVYFGLSLPSSDWEQTKAFRQQRSQELIIAYNNEIERAYSTGELEGLAEFTLGDRYYEIANEIEQLNQNNLYRDLNLQDIQFVNFEFGTPSWVMVEVTVVERWRSIIKNRDGTVVSDDSEECTRTYHVWFDYSDHVVLQASSCDS